MHLVIKTLDKFRKEEGVDAAIEEIEKLQETLEAKMTDLAKEQAKELKEAKKQKGKTAEQNVAA
jgi:hypothetical protein